MDIQGFFRRFFPIARLEHLREEIFALTYCMKGVTWSCIEKMPSEERVWLLKRLHAQVQKESDDMEKLRNKTKSRSRRKL